MAKPVKRQTVNRQKRIQFQLVTNFLNPMEYDKEKVDDMTLALLWLTMFDHGPGTRAWKEFNWEHMNRLHENGYIDDPRITLSG